jgi:hypothetical protein
VPKAQLLNLLVACFARRAGGGAVPVSFDRVYLDAAERLMEDPELARTMPPPVKELVRERQRAKQRRSGRLGGTDRAAAG